jgi:hypothetical protein
VYFQSFYAYMEREGSALKFRGQHRGHEASEWIKLVEPRLEEVRQGGKRDRNTAEVRKDNRSERCEQSRDLLPRVRTLL